MLSLLREVLGELLWLLKNPHRLMREIVKITKYRRRFSNKRRRVEWQEYDYSTQGKDIASRALKKSKRST